MTTLSGLVSALYERRAIQAEQRRERLLARAKGGGCRRKNAVTMLVWMGIILFAMVYMSQHLEGWMESVDGGDPPRSGFCRLFLFHAHYRQ